MEIYLCTKEVAAVLGIAPKTAAKLMREGAISAWKLSAHDWRTTRAAVDAYAQRERARYREILRAA